MALIAPHGADELRPLIADDARRGELEAEALTLPSLVMSSAAAANAVMMGAGYFTPLTGYMNRADALSRWQKTCAPPTVCSGPYRSLIWQRAAR